MRAILAAALAVISTTAVADEVTGTVIAFDRIDGIIVLDDKTVFSLELLGSNPVDDLVAGETVKITFEAAGEDGYTAIESIVRAAN